MVRWPEISGCFFVQRPDGFIRAICRLLITFGTLIIGGEFDMEELLSNAAEHAIRYLESLGEQRVFPSPEACQRLAGLEFDFPDGTTFPERVLATLDETGSPATVAPVE
jgi:hypothetical protein